MYHQNKTTNPQTKQADKIVFRSSSQKYAGTYLRVCRSQEKTL